MKTYAGETEKAVLFLKLFYAMIFYDDVLDGLTAEVWNRKFDDALALVNLAYKSQHTLKPGI